MKLSLFNLLLLLTFFSCHPDKNKLVEQDQLRFNSTDASEIFFKNVRRSYYEVEENREAAFEIYTLSKYETVAKPLLKPQIVFNWRNDFVSIMLNLSDKLKDQEVFVIILENAKGQKKLLYNNVDVRTQTSIAIKLYNGILSGDEIFLIMNKQKISLFKNQEEKDLFRITIFDFLRFVEIR